MEKDYYKRYRVSLNPENDKDRELIDYLEKFSSGSARTHALRELLYNGLKAGNEDIAEILNSINRKLLTISGIITNGNLSIVYSDHFAEIYEVFYKEYEPELRKYNSKILGYTEKEGLYILNPTVKMLDLYDTDSTNSTSKNNIIEKECDII